MASFMAIMAQFMSILGHFLGLYHIQNDPTARNREIRITWLSLGIKYQQDISCISFLAGYAVEGGSLCSIKTTVKEDI